MTSDPRYDEAVIFTRMRAIDETWKLSYAEAGLLCKEVQDRMLWRERCGSFSEWIRTAAPYGYAQAWSALRDVEALADVPRDDLKEIPQANFPVLKQLSTAVRAQPEVLRMAKTAPSEEFIEHVRQEHPDQHIEHRKVLKFHPEASAAEKIEEALQIAMLHGATNRDNALEVIAEEAVMQWRFEDEVAQFLAEELDGNESVQ